MKKIFFIVELLLLTSGFAFGQVTMPDNTLSFKNDKKYIDSSSFISKQNSLTELQHKKDINLSLQQSLNAIFIKNSGFKKEIDYFRSNENVFENEFGRIKMNSTSTSRDMMESYLNMILNK